jgi:hypothetical protein
MEEAAAMERLEVKTVEFDIHIQGNPRVQGEREED